MAAIDRADGAVISADQCRVSTGEDRFARSLGLSAPRDYIAAALLGIVLVFAVSHEQLKKRSSEFATFYVGARLSGTPYLYDKIRNKEEQVRAVHGFSDAFSYVRLPFYATVLSPLGKLPYPVALAIWQTLSSGAIAAFVLLWPSRRMAVVACAWSLPLLMVFMLGEDDNFLLVLLALILTLHRKWPLSTGILMSLLGIKFNLFLLLPVLFIGQTRWRMAAGFFTGCALLLGISFYVAGLDWPARMVPILGQKSILPREYLMPNVRGVLESVTSNLWPELLLDAVVAAVVYVTARKSDFQIALAVMLVGSLLVSHHAGPEDCVVLIPALLLFGDRLNRHSLIYFCLILLCPLPYAALTWGGVPGMAAKLALPVLLGLMCFYTVMSPRKSDLWRCPR